jgi:hypothetical protein
MDNDDIALRQRYWKNTTRHRHVWQYVLRKAMAQERFANDDSDDDDDDNNNKKLNAIDDRNQIL